MPGAIRSNLGEIFVHGDFTTRELPLLLAAMHKIVTQQGYQDIALNFSDCKSAFSSSMLAVATHAQLYWRNNIDISLTLPSNYRLQRLFLNTNWANLIDIRQFSESNFRGHTQVPAIRYGDAAQQHSAVDKILNIVLSAISHFERSHLTAIEWAINEITDNVLNHSESAVGGLVQVSNFYQRNQLEFTVCDVGIGIPHSLRDNNPELQTDHEALDIAIRQGVTRDTKVGQGNGLYGTWRISQLSGGRFEIYSNNAILVSTERDGLHVKSERIPFNGTLVTARIGYGSPLDLKEALKFGEKTHEPVDYLEIHYEEDESGNIKFLLKDESTGFGSRAAGEPIRRKLKNLSKMCSGGCIVVDLSDIPLVSSSYADEVFGKLFIEMGPVRFSNQFQFRNADPLVRDLIDRAITQRSGG